MFSSAKWVFPLFAAIFCSGCGIEPEPIAKLQEAVKASTAQPDDLEPDVSVAENVEVAFFTPYPNRDDPFTFVSRASASRRCRGRAAAEGRHDRRPDFTFCPRRSAFSAAAY
jgi:hypothetical protein